MNDMQQAIKKSLIFGFSGAVIFPFCYEVYANLFPQLAIVLMLAFSIWASVAFLKNKFRFAVLGITAYIAFASIFGILVYIFINPFVENMLKNAKSQYFYLSFAEQLKFCKYAVEIMAIAYIFGLVKAVVSRLRKKFDENGKLAANAVENAFDDDEDKL